MKNVSYYTVPCTLQIVLFHWKYKQFIWYCHVNYAQRTLKASVWSSLRVLHWIFISRLIEQSLQRIALDVTSVTCYCSTNSQCSRPSWPMHRPTQRRRRPLRSDDSNYTLYAHGNRNRGCEKLFYTPHNLEPGFRSY